MWICLKRLNHVNDNSKINLGASQHTKFCNEGPLAAKMCTSLLETAWNGEAWHVTKPVLSHPT
jgi:hypothetical protein